MANHDQLGRRGPVDPSTHAAATSTAVEAIDLALILPKLPSIGSVDNFLQRGIETMRGVDLNELGLRRPEGMPFLTPSLNRIIELRDMREFGAPIDREKFREGVGAVGEQRHQDDYLAFRLGAEDMRFGISTPVTARFGFCFNVDRSPKRPALFRCCKELNGSSGE